MLQLRRVTAGETDKGCKTWTTDLFTSKFKLSSCLKSFIPMTEVCCLYESEAVEETSPLLPIFIFDLLY